MKFVEKTLKEDWEPVDGVTSELVLRDYLIGKKYTDEIVEDQLKEVIKNTEELEKETVERKENETPKTKDMKEMKLAESMPIREMSSKRHSRKLNEDSDPRHYHTKFLDCLEQGIYSYEDVCENLLGWLSDDELEDFARRCDYTHIFEEEEDFDEDEEEIIDEDVSEMKIYQFPELTEDDLKYLKDFDLKVIARVIKSDAHNTEGDILILGEERDLRRFAEKILAYELVDDYLYDAENIDLPSDKFKLEEAKEETLEQEEEKTEEEIKAEEEQPELDDELEKPDEVTQEVKDDMKASVLNNLIVAAWAKIDEYNSMLASLTDEIEAEDIRAVIQPRIDDQMILVGQLEALLEKSMPEAEKIDDGKELVADELEAEEEENNIENEKNLSDDSLQVEEEKTDTDEVDELN